MVYLICIAVIRVLFTCHLEHRRYHSKRSF